VDSDGRPDRRASRPRGIDGTPSHWPCYRFATKLRRERDRIAGCVDALAAALREQYADIGREVAIDGSDMPAYANGQRFLSNHGPSGRQQRTPTHRGATPPRLTRKVAVSTATRSTPPSAPSTGLPLAWQVESGRGNKSLYVAPLLDAVRARGYDPETVAIDRGYDNDRVYASATRRRSGRPAP
jgi:hypothetical protein